MAPNDVSLLADIEAFLARTGMGESYFGKRAVGNSELVPRLRNSGRVWPETEERARAFMRQRQDHPPAHGPGPAADQAPLSAPPNRRGKDATRRVG